MKSLTDVLFDLESKIRQSLSKSDTKKLGVEQTALTQAQGKTPLPEKIVPPKEPIPTPQPPQKSYPEGSPLQKTIGKLRMIENQ